MAKVNFQINDLEIDDAITLIIGFQLGILKHKEEEFFKENAFLNAFSSSVQKIINDCIEAIGIKEYEKLYAKIFVSVVGVTETPKDNLKN